jgi:hypothetical protein
MMQSKILAAVVLVGLCGAVALAENEVTVPGSTAKFPPLIESKIGDNAVKLDITGAALRTKLVFNVYAIASYLQDGVVVHSAEELAAVDAPKQLHLVMERDVDGKDMAAAFRDAIRLNYPAPQFDSEVNLLAEYLQAHPVKKGEHVWLTHVPGVGFHARVVSKTDKAMIITNPAFSKAVWDIYLGKNNLGLSIKEGLTSRL